MDKPGLLRFGYGAVLAAERGGYPAPRFADARSALRTLYGKRPQPRRADVGAVGADRLPAVGTRKRLLPLLPPAEGVGHSGRPGAPDGRQTAGRRLPAVVYRQPLLFTGLAGVERPNARLGTGRQVHCAGLDAQPFLCPRRPVPLDATPTHGLADGRLDGLPRLRQRHLAALGLAPQSAGLGQRALPQTAGIHRKPDGRRTLPRCDYAVRGDAPPAVA